jgi:hypothetical protein
MRHLYCDTKIQVDDYPQPLHSSEKICHVAEKSQVSYKNRAISRLSIQVAAVGGSMSQLIVVFKAQNFARVCGAASYAEIAARHWESAAADDRRRRTRAEDTARTAAAGAP